MGYRTYIGSIPKKEYNKIKSLTVNGLFDFYKDSKNLTDKDDFYIGVYEFGENLYEFGKYTDFQPPKGSMNSFFKKKELKERYSEDEFYIVTKEFLEYVIDSYKKKIVNYYSDLLNPIMLSSKIQAEQLSYDKIMAHIKDMRSEWNFLTPYDLSKGDEITTSWKYEYSIFELVRIYKTFDWKRNNMIYYGY